MRPRTVLLVSNHGHIVGGGEVSLLGLLERLDRSRWSPALVVPAEGDVAERSRCLGVPTDVIPLPSLRRPGRALAAGIANLFRLIRRSDAVVVHANGSRAMFYAGMAGRLARRPVVWHVRIADPDPVLDRILFPLAAAVVVNSRAVARRLDSADRPKVRCIYNGVDLGRFAPRAPSEALRDRLRLPACAPVIASVGRFVGFKGYADLLESAAIVRRARADAHWILAGDGELRGDLERQCDGLDLRTHVQFLGWRRDVPDLLALSDVFVLPSVAEHFGRVLIEAMAMELPVVATNAGGVPEIVLDGEVGLLVPARAPARLAEAVLRLLDDPSRARAMGRAARLRVEREFGLDRHVEAVDALYSELLAS